MKGNIEEDIIKAERFTNYIKTNKDYKDEHGWSGYYNKEIVELARILDHILSDYKRLQKENEELKDKYATFIKMSSEVIANSIPVQKVKDKIEELEQKEKEMHENKNHSNDINKIYKYAVEECKARYGIVFLQELIEEREDK